MTSNVENQQQNTTGLKEVTLADVIGADRAFDTCKSGAEVLFLYYLNKELAPYGYYIDLQKFEFIPELVNCKELAYVASKGYKFLHSYFDKELPSFQKIDNKFFEKDTSELEYRLDEKKENTLVFSESFGVHNEIVYCMASVTAYVNVVARAFVLFFVDGKMLDHLIIDSLTKKNSSEAFYLLPMLQLEGNRSLVWSLTVYPFVESNVRADSVNLYDRLGWVSYNIYLNQLGYGLEQSSIHDKYELIKKEFPVGTVCWLYRKKISKTKKQKGDLRRESTNNNRNLSIYSVLPAIVRSYTDNAIKLEKISNLNTRLGRIYEINAHNMRQHELLETEQDFYDYAEDSKLNTHIEEYNLATIGVEHLHFTEEHFIRKPVDNEKVRVWLYDDKEEHLHELTTTDALYAMLEDWGVQYDKSNYLVTHMKNKRPYYEDYRQYNGEQS